jgi:hypothetical protein
MMQGYAKIMIFFCWLILGLTCCSRYVTPKLPDLDQKSLSHEEILRKQEELKKRVEKARIGH